MKGALPSDIFSPGQVLNNTYEIKGILGRGGTGEVYLAVNQITERLSAIKALNAQFSGNADYLELMKREEQMRNIMHDAVVRYSECSRSDDGHVFLVMDFVDGIALSDLMFERRMETRELLIVAHRVLSGLEATHAKGIVHRDLSPDNIILRDGLAERATIIDFGIAKDTATGARTIVGKDFAGKYEYAAPEQLDGEADFRTDLYALGASLLAVARREVPTVGSNPGEVVRYKRAPLDVSGIDSPLSDLIALIAAPDRDDRPATARAALDRLDGWLKPDSGQRPPAVGRKSKRWAGRGVIAALVVASVLGAGLFATGALDRFLTPTMPTAAPYSLSATGGSEGPRLAGHAPDADSAAVIRAAFAGTTGANAPEDALQMASGVPDPAWPDQVAELIVLMQPLTEWQLDITNRDVEVAGLAPDRETRDALRITLNNWGARTGMSLDSDLLAGPEVLTAGALRPVLDANATCGRLDLRGATEGEYAMFDPVTVTGDVAGQEDIDRIEDAITPMIGERDLRIQTTTLNQEICTVRAVLPPDVAANGSFGPLSIWLGRGDTGEAAMTGVFTTGEYVVADIEMPADILGASLWVMIADKSGDAFNILPRNERPEHLVDNMGTVENGLRRIRIFWPYEALLKDNSLEALEVTDENYGKSELIAILSKSRLDEIFRPEEESVESLAKGLASALEGRDDQIIGVASRIIDARP